MKPAWWESWEYVASAHEGEIDWQGTKAIRIERVPHLGRSMRDWPRYSHELANLLLIAGRGGAGLRCHVDYKGRIAYIVRDTQN